MAKPENRVKMWIKRRMAKYFPQSWSFMPVAGPRGAGGIPDEIYCVPVEITMAHVGQRLGVFVAIEAKAEKGSPTRLQLVQLSRIREAGGFACIIKGTGEQSELMLSQLKELLG